MSNVGGSVFAQCMGLSVCEVVDYLNYTEYILHI